MPAPPSTSHVSFPSQNGATEFIIWSRSCSLSANGNKMPIPRSNPSRITYIATAQPMIAAQPPGVLRRPKIPSGIEQTPAPPQPHAGQRGEDHQHADADHDAEREEGRQDRRPIARRHALETGKQAIPAMGQKKRSAVWDR